MKRTVLAGTIALAMGTAGAVWADAQDIVYTGYGGLDGIDFDCWDFATQASAQAYSEADGGSIWNDADNPDPNGDG